MTPRAAGARPATVLGPDRSTPAAGDTTALFGTPGPTWLVPTSGSADAAAPPASLAPPPDGPGTPPGSPSSAVPRSAAKGLAKGAAEATSAARTSSTARNRLASVTGPCQSDASDAAGPASLSCRTGTEAVSWEVT